jgi:hypothetical protein
LLPLVYEELRKLAAARLEHENPGLTVQATTLMHEAHLECSEEGRLASAMIVVNLTGEALLDQSRFVKVEAKLPTGWNGPQQAPNTDWSEKLRLHCTCSIDPSSYSTSMESTRFGSWLEN